MKAQEIIKSIRYDGTKLTHLKTLSASIDEMDNPKTIDLSDSDDFMIIILLNRLSKIKLTLSQFVPCGADGKPLKLPTCRKLIWSGSKEDIDFSNKMNNYIRAEKNVIFEGWKVVSGRVIESKKGDRIAFYSNGNVYFHKREGTWYLTYLVGTNPSLSDLAEVTKQYPIEFLKSKN